MFFSCQDEEVYCGPIRVSEPPGDTPWNSDRAYIELSDLETVEYIGNFLMKTIFVYENNEGVVTSSYYLVYTDFYKIKASRYWDWYNYKEYISSYKEEYEISAKTLCKVRERVESMGAAICNRKVSTGSNDHAKVGLEITDVIQ